MHARVVRFTDVTPEQIAAVGNEIEGSDGPPPGVDASSIQVLHDAAQGTAVVVIQFESEEKMQAADSVLSDMDASQVPGTRASVDLCAVTAEARVD